MSELSPRARRMLERCRLAEHPEASVRERVWGRVAGTVALTTAATGTAGAAVGGAGAAATSGAGAALGGAGAAASGASLAGGALPTAIAVAKWVGIGMLAGTVTTATVSTMVGPSPSGRPSADVVPRTAPSGVPAMAPAPLRRLPAAAPAPSSEPAPEPPSSSLPAVTPAPDAPRSATSSLAAEARRLEAAQTALNDGDVKAALRELDYYQRDHARGMLSEEAAATKVLALCAAGRVAEARRAAEKFVARYPRSPLLTRVRGSCGLAPTIP